MLERKNAAPQCLMIKALLLSLLDFTVIQIELNGVAQQAVGFGGLLLTWQNAALARTAAADPGPETLLCGRCAGGGGLAGAGGSAG